MALKVAFPRGLINVILPALSRLLEKASGGEGKSLGNPASGEQTEVKL